MSRGHPQDHLNLKRDEKWLDAAEVVVVWYIFACTVMRSASIIVLISTGRRWTVCGEGVNHPLTDISRSAGAREGVILV